MAATTGLHLHSLSITGFRGIDELSIPRLGRVTLLAGKNSIGKTTVLEAIRIYAARGRYSALSGLLVDHEEMSTMVDEDDEGLLEHNLAALFYGREISLAARISIGPTAPGTQLSIETAILSEDQARTQGIFPGLLDDSPNLVLKITYRDVEQTVPITVSPDRSTAIPALERRRIPPRRRHGSRWPGWDEPPPAMHCQLLGPGLLGNRDLAGFWDGVALTADEERALGALRLIFGPEVERVAAIGDEAGLVLGDRRGPRGRRMVVKLGQHERPVPLRSLGDGALRLFAVALGLGVSRDGFLLIDEAENGIHHSVQRDYWRMVLQTAHENNVQVIATTHSWDCIRGFAQAATDLDEADGVLVRLDRQAGTLRAVEYSEEELQIAGEQGIEVR